MVENVAMTIMIMCDGLFQSDDCGKESDYEDVGGDFDYGSAFNGDIGIASAVGWCRYCGVSGGHMMTAVKTVVVMMTKIIIIATTTRYTMVTVTAVGWCRYCGVSGNIHHIVIIIITTTAIIIIISSSSSSIGIVVLVATFTTSS